MATETITFRPSKENSEMLNQLSELAKKDNMKKTTFILAYILTLILGLSAARGQGVTKDAKGNYIQMSSQKATESTAKSTGQTFTDKTGKVYPVMVSKNGKLFVVRVSKNGNTYNMYLPK